MKDKCSWCLQIGVPLVDHHYPVPKAEGGKDVVRICHNCHGRAHTAFLLDASTARTPEAYQALVDAALKNTVREVFPGLWQQGWFIFPANQAIILTPPFMWRGLTDAQIAGATEAVADAKYHHDLAHGRIADEQALNQ